MKHTRAKAKSLVGTGMWRDGFAASLLLETILVAPLYELLTAWGHAVDASLSKAAGLVWVDASCDSATAYAALDLVKADARWRI